MHRFAQLFHELDASTATRDKLAALQRYWSHAPAADAAWAAYVLSGGRPRRAVSVGDMRRWAAQRAGIDDWLFEASYQAVGDLAETIAHLLPAPVRRDDLHLSDWFEQRLLPLQGLSPEARLANLSEWCDGLDAAQRFVLFKLMGGGWRVGVSRQMVTRSLAEHAHLPVTLVAQRMMGYADARVRPDAAAFLALVAPADAVGDALRGTQPYPFFLAHGLDEAEPADNADPVTAQANGPNAPHPVLGDIHDWLVEWKFDGIRAQAVRRDGEAGLWSRGEELLSEAFPEWITAMRAWPDGTVLDGELLAVRTDAAPDGATDTSASPPALPCRPAPFAALQKRILRKRVTPALQAEVPVQFVPYDVLEWQGMDLRQRPQHERRRLLDQVVAPACGLAPSPLLPAADVAALAAWRSQARALGVEGLMLKHRDARYGTGRTRSGGVWLKWKLAPMTVDAVLIYAQAGHGRRANLFTDHTFAVWNRPPRDATEVQAVQDAIAARQPPQEGALQLVTFAKAYSGLSDEELRAVDKVIRQTTVDKFGPVRSLRPTLVFELGFEGIAPSTRHKSGLAVRFPRILRWRLDKPLHEADTLDALRQWLDTSLSQD